MSGSSTAETKNKKALPIILLTVFIDLLGFSIVLPILAPLLALPQKSEILPNTPFDQRLVIFGFLVGSYAIAQFFATPIIGQLSDRFGRKPLLALSLIGTLVARIMFIIGILGGNIVVLFISRIVDGVTGGNISVAQSSIADLSTPQNRSKNFALIGASFGLGFVLGPYLGGKLGEVALVNSVNSFFGTTLFTTSTLPLWFATVLCAVNVVLMLIIFPETIKEKIIKPLRIDTAVSNVVKAFTVGKLRITFITVFLLFLGFSFFTQFLSVYIGTQFQPEIFQDTKDKILKGEITIDVNAALKNIPDEAQKASAKSFLENKELINKYVSSVTLADITADSPDKINYPDYITSLGSPVAVAQAKKGYVQVIQFVNGNVQAESQKRSSDAFSYIGIWVVFAQAFLARRLSKNFKPSTLLKWGLLINGSAALALLVPTQIGWLFVILPFIAIANGLTQPNATAIVSNSADAKSQGEILGINSSVQALAQGVPPIVSGYVAGKLSLSAPILIGSALIFAAFIVFVLFYKENSKEILHEE